MLNRIASVRRTFSTMTSQRWSRLIRFEDEHGKTHYGQPILENEELKQSDLKKGLKAHLVEGDVFGEHTVTDKSRTVKKLLAPVTPSIIRCIGLNYRRHAQETGSKIPVKPILFMKPPSSACGPYDTIRVPHVAQDDMVDYEAELAVVIGKKCRDISKEQALNYVAGYTICNDVSSRNWQMGPKSGGQWNFSKGFDTFAPLGPMIVSSSVITDPQTLKLGTRLDGQLLQDYTTSDMIFDVSTIVSFLSQGTTLMPGDVIITGTPHGVGYTRSPPVLLKHGTKCEIYIERIGNIVNPVEYERGQSKL
ncbi:hypothetical protein K450DRAFT_247927 [Umbelopsis ramanniana AG]|uniref:Fumarylacetoacetase-like C-terminal domain-containing protein n=1 Tax=Umbelopsis ramanniana AG TaxID=1314678 RepID=A0AAD5E8E8_UMBRA|nr:uncharacterized protein K450DRAFT_247927 [Umbelopsis ramanniana AG]KAI8578246.1 hypothetical protein K450DRAFT_247927 [Umbelopsis ramanniana AG]